nr:uncharacterized protein LOC128690173 [Cherax quadricarinatus]
MAPTKGPGAMYIWLLVAVAITLTDASHKHSYSPHFQHTSWLVEERSLSTLVDLDEYMEDLVKLARLQISKAFTEESRRYRRALDMASIKVKGTEDVGFELDEDQDFGTKQVTGFHFFTHEHASYWIFGSSRTEMQTVASWSPASRTLTTIAKFQLTFTSLAEVNIIAAQFYNGFIILALGSSTSRFVSIVCINVSTRQLSTPQVIPSRGVVGALHLFKALEKLYLVIGEQYFATPGDDAANSAMYVMVGEYFDYLDDAQLTASGVTDITGFADAGSYYLVFGMQSMEGSRVYEFNLALETLTLTQQLPETRVLSVHHYLDHHDNKHYVLLMNNDAPNIYWWNHKQLQKWQVLDYPDVIDLTSSVGVLPLHNLENLLFVTTGATITLYGDDLTGHYSPSFSLHTSCITVKDVYGVRLENNYYIVYICSATVDTLEAKVLDLEDIILDEEPGDPLLRCLADLSSMLTARKSEVSYLEEVIVKDTLMSVNHAQVWSGPVVFPELTVTGEMSVSHPVVIGSPVGATGTNESVDHYEAALMNLETEVEAIKEELPMVLLYSGSQTISGPITATSLSVDHVYFDALVLQKVNGFHLGRTAQEFLLDDVDQTIEGMWHVDYLGTRVFSTLGDTVPGMISGVVNKCLWIRASNLLATVPTMDYMRCSAVEQTVLGQHTYKTLLARKICDTHCRNSSIIINGINTADIVTKESNVTLSNKAFTNVMITGTVSAETVNSMVVRRLAHQAVYTDRTSTQTLVGNFTLSTVLVKGNVAASSINGLNIVDLDSSVVKRHGNYRLAGGLVFAEDLVVSGSVLLDSINEVLWSNIVDTNSLDQITSTYHFSDVSIESSLDSDSINGVNLSDGPVLVDTNQIINGYINFKESVGVSGSEGVIMEEGATVNTIDPSSLQTLSGVTGTLLIDEEIIFQSPLILSGNVKAPSINGFLLDSLDTLYWRKSEHQSIETTGYILNAVFQGPVMADTLNGWMITDYLQNTDQETVFSDYSFQGSVFVRGGLVMRDGSKIDNVDVSELIDQIVTVNGSQTIFGHKKFIGKVNVVDLELQGRLNGLDVTKDLMRLDQNLPQTGHLTFTSPIDMMTLDVVEADVTLESLNGLDVLTTANNMVLLGENATVSDSSGLQFTGDVHVKELLVHELVDGVNIEDLVRRAIKKSWNTSQRISSRVVVEGDVYLAGPASLSSVNGEDWNEHLNNVVLLNYSGEISGRKTFTLPLYMQGHFNPTIINGLSLHDFSARLLTRSGEQVIRGTYTFTDIIARELFAPMIDGQNLSNILLIDEAQHVDGSLIFKEVSMYGLTSDTGVLDGCDLQKLQSGAIWKDVGELNINAEVTIDTLVVEGAATATADMSAVKAGNKIDVINFLNSLVLKSSDQNITGMVHFLNDMHFTHLNVDTINSVNVEEFLRVGVMKDESVVINCDLSFTKGLTVKHVEVKSAVSGGSSGGVLLNGVNITDVHSRAVYADGGSVEIVGRKVFLNALSVHHLVAEYVGSVAVQNLVVPAREVSMAVDFIFTAPIIVFGNVLVSGLVDGIDLEDFFSTRAVFNTTQTLFGSYTFEAMRVEGDLQVEMINNVSISDLVLRYSSSQQVISGTKILNGGLVVTGDIFASTLNGLDLWKLNNTLVRLDRSVTINTPVVFEKKVTCSVKAFVKNTVNDLDLSELSRNLSTLRTRITEHYHRIDSILNQFGSLHEENYETAKGLYSELSYLEKIDLPRDTNVYGRLWTGRIPGAEGQYLKIISCPDPPCRCSTQCHKRGMDRTQNSLTIVLKLDEGGEKITQTWSIKSAKEAVDIDLAFTDNTWFLFVANTYDPDDTIAPYTTTSQLFTWSHSTQMFTMVAEYVADHTSSVSFLQTVSPLEETLFTLAQLKLADSPAFRDCLKYTTKVLVFRYNMNTRNFEAYQSLAAYGVVDQAVLHVDDTLYLLLLSNYEDSLYVYEYLHREGFILLYKIRVKDPYSVLIMEVERQTFVVVSTSRGLERFKVHLKGVSPDLL